MLKLSLKEGEQTLPMKLGQDVITLGRSADNTIVFKNRKASRHHARIERIGAAYQITDLGSGNGTKVNGQKVDFQALKKGDEVKIGDGVLIIQGIDDDPADLAIASDAEETPLELADEIRIHSEETEIEIRPQRNAPPKKK